MRILQAIYIVKLYQRILRFSADCKFLNREVTQKNEYILIILRRIFMLLKKKCEGIKSNIRIITDKYIGRITMS
jgi:hypothetical protein